MTFVDLAFLPSGSNFLFITTKYVQTQLRIFNSLSNESASNGLY